MMKAAVFATVYVLLIGCTVCREPRTAASSPDSRYTAEVSFDGGCGGATTGYITTVRIKDSKGRVFTGRNTILEIRGGVRVNLKWATERNLRCEYFVWDDSYNVALRQIARVHDVDINYVRSKDLER